MNNFYQKYRLIVQYACVIYPSFCFLSFRLLRFCLFFSSKLLSVAVAFFFLFCRFTALAVSRANPPLPRPVHRGDEVYFNA